MTKKLTGKKKTKSAVKPVTKPRTYVALILDKSGSMASTKTAAITGFNEQVQQLKEDAKTQDILCSLVTFNGEVFEHLWNVPAEQLAEAAPEDFSPNGNTAMLDAVGYTVQKLLSTTDHEDPNAAYLIVVISDGQTNMDKYYNWETLKELTQGCEASKKWTFTYMGCTKDYMEQLARNTGTPVSNMGAWSNRTTRGAAAGFENLKARSKKYFTERSAGQLAACNYSSDVSGMVADFESMPITAAEAAPVLIDPADLPKVDFKSVLERQPKYESQRSPSYNGGPLFANSMKVAWTNAAANDLAQNRMATVMPANRTRSALRGSAVNNFLNKR